MKTIFLSLTLALLLQGCTIYKIDIQQGNEVTAKMLANIEIGMSKEEVRKVLGYPLINDPFHADRWDYYFYIRKGATGKSKQWSATLHFTGDVLSDIENSLRE